MIGYVDGKLPAGVTIGEDTVITGDRAFKSYRATLPDALVVGSHCTLDGVSFAVGHNGRLRIGDHCYFCGAVLLCDQAVTLGNRVALCINVCISDTDFHPIDPLLRMNDAIACSNIANGRPRPQVVCRPVVIEDDVWVGPNATILKGVRIGAGSFIEPGSLVTRDVPPGSRVMGNPARVIEGVP